MNRKNILTLVMLVTLSACASTPVQPWEKGVLANPDMAPESSPLTSSLDDHIYFSKEGTSGGRGFAGGGCGCN